MGTFAETAIVDYSLLFADQGEQTSFSVFVRSRQKEVCRFRFPFVANKRNVPFSVSSISVYIYIEIYIRNIYVYIYVAISKGKRKPRRFSLILDQTEVICLQKD